MSTSLPPADGWEPVAPGSLERCAQAWRGRERRRRLVSAASVLMLVLGFGGAFWWLLPPTTPLIANRITCNQCHDLAVDFVRHKLDRQQTLDVESHLSHCPHCVDYVNAVKAGPPRAERQPAPDHSPLVALIDDLPAASR
jgi:hypothetical protein